MINCKQHLVSDEKIDICKKYIISTNKVNLKIEKIELTDVLDGYWFYVHFEKSTYIREIHITRERYDLIIRSLKIEKLKNNI